MARKKEIEKRGLGFHSIKEETTHAIYAIIFFVLAVVLVLSSLGKAGIVGNKIYNIFSLLLGVGYYLLPLIFLVLAIIFIRSLQKPIATMKIVSAGLLFFALLGIVDMIVVNRGGIVGNLISYPLVHLFDIPASYIILATIILISILIIIDTRPTFGWLFGRKVGEEGIEGDDPVPATPAAKPVSRIEESETEEPEEVAEKPVVEPEVKRPKEMADGFAIMPRFSINHKKFVPPPISLLEYDKGKPGVGDIKANANIIKRTLQNFGINVEMDEISIGPSVTRYALKPAEGVKLSKIVTLQNDLSLALAAHPIRIEAPIPGKSLVGIEIPNNTKTTVGLASLLSESEYQESDKPLLISLGKGISGKSYFTNLAKSPHLLIAGSTGSGKSVTIHAILTSLLYRNSPDNLKFIMIDPKRVELTLYNKIPHLLTPVITDAKKAILSLKWAAKEMDRRYDLLESHAVRDIESYHKTILAPELKRLEGVKDEEGVEMPETMPYIVVVIDELADIMQTYPRELESAIVRLAQMSRAVGIHLILSTQRPSVNVITGLIKANVPSRIALQVTSQIDSRTILDTGGAEKLLGAGDMLFLSGEMSKPQRIQSSYISEGELKNVVKYFAENYELEMPMDITANAEHGDKNAIFESSFSDEGDDDELYEEARDIVIKAGKASTSYIQRKLRVGYARAARLVDMLEERGVIGPGEGSKPRDVINPGAGTGAPAPALETETYGQE